MGTRSTAGAAALKSAAIWREMEAKRRHSHFQRRYPKPRQRERNTQTYIEGIMGYEGPCNTEGTEHHRMGNQSENKLTNAQHAEINKIMGGKSEFVN